MADMYDYNHLNTQGSTNNYYVLTVPELKTSDNIVLRSEHDEGKEETETATERR